MKRGKVMMWGMTLAVCVMLGVLIGAAVFPMQNIINERNQFIIKPGDNDNPTNLEYDILDIFSSNTLSELPDGVSKFESFDEFEDFLDEHHGTNNTDVYYSGMSSDNSRPSASMMMGEASANSYGGEAHSTTNVQVVGVDEGDIVKNDEKYAYVVSEEQNSIYIVEVCPAGDSHIVCQMFTDGHIIEIYVVEDILVVIEQGYYFDRGYYSCSYQYSEDPVVIVRVYDIENRKYPLLTHDASVIGHYSASRTIGDYIYLIVDQYIYNIEEEADLPVPADDIYCLDDAYGYYVLNTFLTLDIKDSNSNPNVMTLLMDSGDTIYVSEDNMYLTHTKYAWNDWGYIYDDDDDREKTIIHKISIDEGDIEYAATGDVPGHVLNRYSMDEHEGFFRIATSTGWMENNQLYVLDENLDIVGEIENIAPGEKIYSARFMGARVYLVTFKQVDPFFVIDLSDPYDPEILGELKITGYSDYLHPYDENHIIGLGKDTVDTGEWARFQGLKLSLFDVTDVENPIEVDKHMIIGDRGTDSLALRDPHAFLFSREKNLLVIPVTLYEHQNSNVPPYQSGYYTWEGAYVIHVTEEGFSYEGRITHQPDNQTEHSYYQYEYQVKRSFYIDDTLYTVSDTMLKANGLEHLNEISSVVFEE